MLKKLNDIQRGSIIGLIIFFTTFTNYIFTSGSFVASCFCISIGFALGFYIQFKHKILPYIFISILLGHFIARVIYIDEELLITIVRSSGFAIVSVFVVVSLNKILTQLNVLNVVSLRSSILFTSSAIMMSIVAGAMISSMILLDSRPIDPTQLFIKWSTGYLFGIMIFGVTILYSYYYDEKADKSFKNTLNSIIFISSFIIISSILFSGTVDFFLYEDYAYIFVAFYLVMAFFFSYRMILLIDVIFVLLYQLFFIRLGTDPNYIYLIMSINLYLFLLSSLAATVKMVIYDLDRNNKALVESTHKLESLVYSTESLLKLSDDILGKDMNIHEDYLKRIFKIACNIFDNYDYASCFIKGDKYVNFVAGVGFDPKVLNSFNFESDKTDYIDTDNPFLVVTEEKSVQTSLGDRYEEFTKIYPKMSQAIRFGIYIDENTKAGMSFDITEESGKKFNRAHLENYKSFQKLMNSFFSINYLSYKNISLKNDIVLSLIRTLELFDQYTGGHSEEVAYLSNEIGKICGLDDKDLHDIYWAGVVHDIGKVGIDTNIINKPDKLSLEEYEQIKEHSIFGYEILNKSDDLKTIALLVKHHHEWWNGAGYPDSLKGERIPFGSQIISVCDAVSTMAKKRPYTIVKTSREIIEELELYKGVQFSPKPTDAMIKFISEGHLDEFYKKR